MLASQTLTFAVTSAALYAGHQLGDHLLGQTDTQAAGKAQPGWAGRRALIRHVIQYHLVLAGTLAIAVLALHMPVTPVGLAAGGALSVVTHAVLDRRWPLIWLMEHTGSRSFAALRLPITGASVEAGWHPGRYAADQACHTYALFGAALLISVL